MDVFLLVNKYLDTELNQVYVIYSNESNSKLFEISKDKLWDKDIIVNEINENIIVLYLVLLN